MQQKEPLVSILIANYNNVNYIEEAIKSVVAQTYSNWEMVIVDDASTDSSWSVIQQLAQIHPNICCCRNETNRKVGETKARATSLAKGEICAILDPDDALEPTAVEKHVAVYLKNPACSLVGSNYYECDENLNISLLNEGVFQPEKFYSYLASNGGIHHFWSFCKKKYALTEGFDASFVLAEDQDLFYKLEEVGNVQTINEPLYYYRMHQNAISQGNKIALAYAYHIIAQLNALKRRKSHKTEKTAVKEAVVTFMDWGIMKIEKTFRLTVVQQTVFQFPSLLLKRKVWSVLYHTIR